MPFSCWWVFRFPVFFRAFSNLTSCYWVVVLHMFDMHLLTGIWLANSFQFCIPYFCCLFSPLCKSLLVWYHSISLFLLLPAFLESYPTAMFRSFPRMYSLGVSQFYIDLSWLLSMVWEKDQISSFCMQLSVFFFLNGIHWRDYYVFLASLLKINWL